MRHSFTAAELAASACLLAACLAVLLLSGCRLRETGQEDLVVPELVRTHLYVSPPGSDSNPGTRGEPFRARARGRCRRSMRASRRPGTTAPTTSTSSASRSTAASTRAA